MKARNKFLNRLWGLVSGNDSPFLFIIIIIFPFRERQILKFCSAILPTFSFTCLKKKN